MYLLPLVDGGEIGPIPMWYQGETTGIGWSSGATVSSFRLLIWQTSQLATYYNIRCKQIMTFLRSLTSSFTSFVIPGQINLSVILDSVLFHPICPEVGSWWHDSMVFFRSRGSVMKRTYKFKAYSNILVAFISKIHSLLLLPAFCNTTLHSSPLVVQPFFLYFFSHILLLLPDMYV